MLIDRGEISRMARSYLVLAVILAVISWVIAYTAALPWLWILLAAASVASLLAAAALHLDFVDVKRRTAHAVRIDDLKIVQIEPPKPKILRDPALSYWTPSRDGMGLAFPLTDDGAKIVVKLWLKYQLTTGQVKSFFRALYADY